MTTRAPAGPLIMLGSAPDSGGAWAAAAPASTTSSATSHAILEV